MDNVLQAFEERRKPSSKKKHVNWPLSFEISLKCLAILQKNKSVKRTEW